MIILGIDPGTAIVGWGVIRKYQTSNIKCQNFGVIRTSPKLADSQRLSKIASQLQKIITKYRPSQVAVEKLFYFKNQKTVMQVAQARGVILQVCADRQLPISEYTPLQVKQAICSYGRADKGQMQRMVKLHLGLKEIPQPDDAADALAVAVTHANTHRYPEA